MRKTAGEKPAVPSVKRHQVNHLQDQTRNHARHEVCKAGKLTTISPLCSPPSDANSELKNVSSAKNLRYDIEHMFLHVHHH